MVGRILDCNIRFVEDLLKLEGIPELASISGPEMLHSLQKEDPVLFETYFSSSPGEANILNAESFVNRVGKFTQPTSTGKDSDARSMPKKLRSYDKTYGNATQKAVSNSPRWQEQQTGSSTTPVIPSARLTKLISAAVANAKKLVESPTVPMMSRIPRTPVASRLLEGSGLLSQPKNQISAFQLASSATSNDPGLDVGLEGEIYVSGRYGPGYNER